MAALSFAQIPLPFQRVQRIHVRHCPAGHFYKADGTHIIDAREFKVTRQVTWFIFGERFARSPELIGQATEVHKGDHIEKIAVIRADLAKKHPWALHAFDKIVEVMDEATSRFVPIRAVAKK